MIKAITTIRHAASPAAYEKLCALLDGLGFDVHSEWKHASSKGRSFLAPAGRLELVSGKLEFPSDLWIEVSDLDSILAQLEKQKAKITDEVQATGWGSRMFAAEVGGLGLVFWQQDVRENDATEGDLNAKGMRFGIVVARWNSFITERLLQGAMDALRRSGCRTQDITVVRVPGSFEIPSQSRTMAITGKYDAIITLGCLIRGETTHYEHISTEVTRGIGQSAQETGVPHTYGVLTCEDLEQALDRAGLKAGNKGFEAAMSAIEMVSLKRKTSSPVARRRASKSKGKRR